MQVVHDQTSGDEQDVGMDAIGSYGRGIYAGQSTFGGEYCHQGSYGRGIYAGLNTYEHDNGRPGSYGRGIYARHSTHDLDFRCNGSYARGMEARTDLPRTRLQNAPRIG
jgi:hypothetical protein